MFRVAAAHVLPDIGPGAAPEAGDILGSAGSAGWRGKAAPGSGGFYDRPQSDGRRGRTVPARGLHSWDRSFGRVVDGGARAGRGGPVVGRLAVEFARKAVPADPAAQGIFVQGARRNLAPGVFCPLSRGASQSSALAVRASSERSGQSAAFCSRRKATRARNRSAASPQGRLPRPVFSASTISAAAIRAGSGLSIRRSSITTGGPAGERPCRCSHRPAGST